MPLMIYQQQNNTIMNNCLIINHEHYIFFQLQILTLY